MIRLNQLKKQVIKRLCESFNVEFGDHNIKLGVDAFFLFIFNILYNSSTLLIETKKIALASATSRYIKMIVLFY